MSAHADHSSSDEGVDDENSSSDEDVDDATMEAAFSDDSGSGSEDEEEDDHRLPGPRSHVTWDDIIEPISFAEVRRVLQTVGSVTILITISNLCFDAPDISVRTGRWPYLRRPRRTYSRRRAIHYRSKLHPKDRGSVPNNRAQVLVA